jgi:FixJ family two-component response regulator
MNRKNWTSVWTLTLGALLLVTPIVLGGCSGEKEEAGVVEQASDKVAKKAVDYINKPLDKAKQSQAVQNAQSQKMDDMVQESGE